MNERQAKALQLREEGKTFKEVGEALGVSTERARQIFATAQRKKNAPRITWTDGLEPKLANALIAARYTSRDDVRAAVERGEIAVKNGRGTVPWIGPASVAEIRAWLGMESAEIADAIALLERHGYTVIPP
ncbi:MAG: hypothetical protein H6948_01055 [Zoogloeaceae bacterium]|nr:hypothetical protein [Zoogloeaceae bacterium]